MGWLFWREHITRHDNSPYLTRTHLFKLFGYSVFLHEFVGGDDPCMHNHPWDFVSILLKGWYIEFTPEDPDNPLGEFEKACFYSSGGVLYRPAKWIHRVDIGTQKRVVTLVIHGRKYQPWGFFTKLYGWIHHSKYSYVNHCAT